MTATYGPFALTSYPCALCGESKSRVVMTKKGAAVPLPFSIVACRRCGHVRVDPRIPDERLDELYDAAYYRGDGFDRTVDYDAPPSAETKAANDAVLDTVAEARGGSIAGARWLDVGCGTGGLLDEARRRGAITHGTDSSAFAAAACAKKGITLLGDAQVKSMRDSFDVVSAIEVIEHVPQPRELLGFLRARVRPGGVVYVGTGNWNLLRRQPETPYLMPEGHIQYFTPEIMRRLFAESGLREAPVLNRSWFVARRARGVVPGPAIARWAKVAIALTPSVAPFPVGIRTG